MRITFKLLTRLYAVLFCLTLGAFAIALHSLREQWRQEERQAAVIQQKLLEQKDLKIEQAFSQIYQNLRLISLFPSIRGFSGTNQSKDTEEKFNRKFFTDDMRISVQQIYNNLASHVAISEVYGVEKDFHPELGDKPFFMLDELILQDKEEKSEEIMTDGKNQDIPEKRKMRNTPGLSIKSGFSASVIPAFILRPWTPSPWRSRSPCAPAIIPSICRSAMDRRRRLKASAWPCPSTTDRINSRG